MPPGGDPLRSPHGAQRTHVFVPGLRFDTELQFQAQARGARRAWRKLPMAQVQAKNSGWVALRQACALATGTLPSMEASAWGSDLWSSDGSTVAQRITDSRLGLVACWHLGWHGADQAAHLPRASFACLDQTEGRTWALITGVELCERMAHGAGQAKAPHARAWLLLDPRRAAPWGVAYNSRLQRARGRWRGIDGEVGEARLAGWISLGVRFSGNA